MTNRQIIIMCILLLLPAIYYGVSTYPQQERIDRNRPTVVKEKTTSRQEGETSSIRFDLLENRTTDGSRMSNNIFGPLFPIVTPKIEKRLPPPIVKAPAPPPPEPTPTVEEIVRQELAQFTFLGLVKKKGLYKVFLSQGEEIFVVGAGDRFGPDDKFTVKTLSITELVVRQSKDPRDITIPLVERQKLQATFE